VVVVQLCEPEDADVVCQREDADVVVVSNRGAQQMDGPNSARAGRHLQGGTSPSPLYLFSHRHVHTR
jgi:hypothetical protein